MRFSTDRSWETTDASTDRLALHLTSAALAVALASLAEEQTHALWGKNTLHHWETLFVVSSRDAESVSLELIAEGVAIDLLGDTLVEEWQPEGQNIRAGRLPTRKGNPRFTKI